MKKITLLLAFLIPLTTRAQVSQASYDSLLARVAKLEQAQGPYADSIPPTDSFPTKCVTLPNGRYTVFCRVQQIGIGIDDNNIAVSGMRAQITGALARIAAIESAVAGGQPVGTAVFDKIRVNKICIGDADCNPDWNAQLQIRGVASAVMGFEANLNNTDPQDPTHTHVSQFGVSQDGGTRLQQNAMLTYSRGFIGNVNPCRAWLNLGPDSRASLSLYLGAVDENTCAPIAHDRSQDLVFLADNNAKEIKLFLPRPLWGLRLVGSTFVNAGDLTLQLRQ